MNLLYDVVDNNRDWLKRRALSCTKMRGTSPSYTTTEEKAWRAFVADFSPLLFDLVRSESQLAEPAVEVDADLDAATSFGLQWARKRQSQSVSLGRFLQLVKCYHRSLVDLVQKVGFERADETQCHSSIDRLFDRLELGLCEGWVQQTEPPGQAEAAEESVLLRTLIDSLPDYVYVKDIEARFRVNNLAHLLAMGLSTQSDALGKTDLDVFSEELGQKYYADDLEVMRTGAPIHGKIEPFVDRTTDEKQWVMVTKVPLRDGSGKVMGLMGISRDITTRMATEEALAAEKELLSVTLQSIGDGVITTDVGGNVISMNRIAEELTGWTQSEVAGRPLDEVFHMVHEQTRQAGENPATRVLQTGEAFTMGGQTLLIARDGTERIIADSGAPIYGKDGAVLGVVLVFRDVTERTRAEEDLQRSQQALSVLMSNLPGMAYRCHNDARRTMEFVSEGCVELTRYEPFELIGNREVSYSQLIHPAEREAVSNEIQHALQEGRPFELSYRIITAEGEDKWVWEQGRGVLDPDGTSMHIDGFISDITRRVEAEAERDRQRFMLNTMMDTTSDILIFKNRRSAFLASSKVIADILGKTQEELVGKTDFDLWPTGTATRFWEEEQRVMDTAQPVVSEHLLEQTDGRSRWFEAVKKPIFDDGGQVVGLFSSEHDITERKQMEEAIASERTLLRTLIDNLTDLVYLKDTQGRMLLNNMAHARFFGESSPQDVLGKTDFDYLPLELAQKTQEDEQEIIRTGLPMFKEEPSVDSRTGERLWVATMKAPVRDSSGKVIGIVGLTRDLSERERAAEDLRRAHEELKRTHEDLELRVQERTADLAVANVKLQVEIAERREAQAELQWQYHQAERARSETMATIDATSEAMVLISPERWILSINRRFTEFFGLSPSETLGNRFEDLRPETERILADPSAFIALISATTLDTEQNFTQLIAQNWPRKRELEVFSTPVRTGEGQYLGRLFVFRDVTREREVDRMKTEFVSMVSHELRTPLTSIKGYVDLLLGGKVGQLADDQHRFLTVVKNNADRLVSLINDLLDVSRIESGKVELRRTVLDLGRLIRDVSNSLQPQLEAKSQMLATDIAEDLPAVWADADRITVILTNLLSNAHKYTGQGGRVTIRTSSDEAKVRVDVEDTGIGMTPEEQSKLFTRFFRADNLVTQQIGGTGLGLVITRSLVEMHGGEIWVSSEPGVGSTFSFTLPTIQRPPEFELAPVVETAEIMTGAGRRILVVDDEPDIADLMRMYLERSGYQVLIAHNAADAFNVAQVERVDLITLDVLLPDVDGFTLLEWLKNEPKTKDIPVVLISILADDGHGEMLGAVDYLIKPVSEELVLEHLQRILGDSAEDRGPRLVLVADDELDIRELVSAQLSHAGYQVICATNGVEAVEMARREHPQVVLLDIKMPVMDGITALRMLRSEKATRDLPVVMMTASPGLYEASKSVTQLLGVSALLRKPFSVEELATAISKGVTSGHVSD